MAVLNEVLSERLRQDARRLPPSARNITNDQWLTILIEEVGEVARAIQEADGSKERDFLYGNASLRTELIQVAAVAVAMIEAQPKKAK